MFSSWRRRTRKGNRTAPSGRHAGVRRVIGPGELAFPDYDGNGMFKSLGNVLVNPAVGSVHRHG